MVSTTLQRPGINKYCCVYDFEYHNVEGAAADMIMTSVLGHIESLDFSEDYSNWQKVDPLQLLYAPLLSKYDSKVQALGIFNVEQQGHF